MAKTKKIKICDCGQSSSLPRIEAGVFNPINGLLTLTRSDGSTVTATIPLTGDGGLGGGGHVIVNGIDEEQNQRAKLKFGSTFIVSDEPLDDQTHIEDVLYVTELPNDLEVPESVGGIQAGTTVATLNGESISTILNRILFPATEVVYTAPTMTLAGISAANTQMVGNLFSPQLLGNFTQNDAGAVSGYTLYRNGAPIANVSTYTDLNYERTTPGPVVYQMYAAYGTGPILEDNYGNPQPIGQIMAANAVSNTVNYNVIYPWYWGTSNSPTITDLDIIAGTRVLSAITGEITFTPAASGEYIWFAVPSATPTFTNWEFTPLNAGQITPGSLFEGIDSVVSVTAPGSGSGFTTNFELYVSAFATTSTDPLTLTY